MGHMGGLNWLTDGLGDLVVDIAAGDLGHMSISKNSANRLQIRRKKVCLYLNEKLGSQRF